jgi:hypothetical protein
MISFSAPEYNPIGALIIHREPEDLFAAQRRATVTPTLDGGVSVYDTGYSVADRTIRLRLKKPTLMQIGALSYLIQLYPRLIISTRAGCYRGLAEYQVTGDTLTVQIRLTEELS